MPGGVLPGLPDPLPIKLQEGNAYWGAVHIEKRHGHWLANNKHSVASMVHFKLSQSGTVYSAEQADKSTIRLNVSPAGIIVLKHISNGEFLSVTSLYFKKTVPDGEALGRYYGQARGRLPRPGPEPHFAAPEAEPEKIAESLPSGVDPQVAAA